MLHKIEKVRDELVEKGDVALTDLLNDYPNGDRQQLRNLIRSAQKNWSKINHRKPIEKFIKCSRY